MKNKTKIILLFLIAGYFLPYELLSQVISIEDAVKTGIQNNPMLKAAELNIQKQEALKLKSVNIPNPQFFIEYEGIKGSFESRKIGVLQELEFPSSYFYRAEIQNSELSVARSERDIIFNELKHEIKKNYFALLLQTALLNEARENLKIYEEFLVAAERKYDAGSTSNLEVLSAKVNRVKYENEIRNTESQVKLYRAELKRLMNSGIDIIPSEELKIAKIQSSLDELLNTAEKNNPELIAERFQKEKFSAKTSLSRSELFPDFSVRYYKQKIGTDGGFWGFELGIDVPLWFWWQPAGNVKEADLDYRIAVNNEIIVKRKIESEIKRSYEEYLGNIRQLEFITTDAISESNEILRQTRTSYIEGSIDYVEMLQALTLSYELKIQYLNILFNVNSSINDLEMLTSGFIKFN